MFAIKFIAAALATTAIFAATATAAPRDKTVVVTASPSADDVVRRVGYSDLNLANASGEKQLVTRVHYAVSDVCRVAVGGTLGYTRQTANCRTKAWDGASPQIDRAVHRARDIAANGWSAIAPVAIQISIR